MPNPPAFLEHLQALGYHPRSDRHSNALAQAIVADLVTHCPKIRERARAGELVYELNFTLLAGTAEWNVDLVLGPPALGGEPVPGVAGVARQTPSAVQIAIELKAVMTEHRKAVKNRKRDLEAHHEHVHNYHQDAIAGGVLIVNASPTFRSPLRPEVTEHRNPTQLVERCIAELRAVASRGGPRSYGLDACCAIVVVLDNVNLAATRYLTTRPAPGVGDPLHYDGFIRAVCDQYHRRFS